MRVNRLREAVCAANKKLPETGLVMLTWGNVSAFDRESQLMVIKPSGVPYEQLTPGNMVLVDLAGQVVEGDLQPSSDTATHLELYRQFPSIGSIVHTHSPWATTWAQLGRSIPALGTTHADDFGEEIICTRPMRSEEIQTEYERNTGRVIVEALEGRDMEKHFAVLVHGHGPFVWERTPEKTVEKAMVLENVAMMAWRCHVFSPDVQPISDVLLRKHFDRKHGTHAYYGQR